MACIDCLQNCPEIISDQCVQYTGPTIPAPINVCQGSQLPVFEANIVAALQSALNGSGIFPIPININTCTWIQQQFGILPLNLSNIVQVLINSDCGLDQRLTNLQTQFDNSQSGTVIDTACLTGLSTTPTTPQILQAVITLLCSVNTTVNNFPTTYVSIAALPSLVTPIVNQIISGGSSVTQYGTRMVPFAAQPYFGPLSNFDSTGAGLNSLGFNRVFLCNGNNGTPDLRGRVPVGAIRNVPGGSLDPAVDPTVNPNNPNWGLLDKAGETFHTLTVPELAAHNHGVTDPGHSHTSSIGTNFNASCSGGNCSSVASLATSNVRGTFSQPTQTATTGISIQNTGGNQPHNNIQPSIACYYIMYIP